MDNGKIYPKGVSGTQYPMEVYPWNTSFKAVGGVYMVLRKQFTNGSYDPLYVGETGDLSERFDSHHKQYCFDQNHKSHIAVMVENSQARRLTIEADLVNNYHPPCNG